MTPEEIRLRCIEAAIPLGYFDPVKAIQAAKVFEAYVTAKTPDSLQSYHGTPVGTDGEGGETVIL